MSRNPHSSSSTKILLTILIILMVAATALVIWLCINLAQSPVPSTSGTTVNLETTKTPETTEAPTTAPTMPEPERVVATATLGSMGDLLMHMPLFSSQYNSTVYKGGDDYDFTPMFQYIQEDISALDYAVANLETTLAGLNDGYSYSGFPHFNCPDQIVDGAKNAGFDMLLTANNHSYDTRYVGYSRTLDIIEDRGLVSLGTRRTPEEPRYQIEEVNGIRIGMLCYTYASHANGKVALNGNAAMAEKDVINSFDYTNLPAFYSELSGYLEEMKKAGVDATVVYLHWGEENQLSANAKQKAIAQAVCDLGVDVIIGGHPHVVQPMDLLTSTVDESHKTVVLYSMGNAVSNQRLGSLTAIQTAHTEDGLLFTLTFHKYSDGKVYLAETDIIPTWVNKFTNDEGKLEYDILPLHKDQQDKWPEKFHISEGTANAAANSYQRTWNIVGEGLEKCQSYLAQAMAERDAYYLDLVTHPKKYQTGAETIIDFQDTTMSDEMGAAA